MIDIWMADRPDLSTAASVAVAVENHYRQTITSGPEREVTTSLQDTKAGCQRSRYIYPTASIIRLSAPAVTAFAARLAARPNPFPRRLVYSPIIGRYNRSDDIIWDCLARHLTMRVRFSSAARRIRTEGVIMRGLLKCSQANNPVRGRFGLMRPLPLSVTHRCRPDIAR